MANKARYWEAICYPENMKEDWQISIGDDLQGFPYAYAIHDKDNLADYEPKRGEEHQRKTHVHIIIAFTNTTTANHAFEVFSALSAECKQCLSTVRKVSFIRNAYEYLIHNTETAKKQGKYLYDASERITGNNFDIGAYEQITAADRDRIRKELGAHIISEGFTNFLDFYMSVVSNYDDMYLDVVATNSAFFERLTRGGYQKAQMLTWEKHEKLVNDAIRKARLEWSKEIT